MNSTFFIVLVVGIFAVVSPGPDFLIVSRNSLLYSKRAGLMTTFGIAVGNLWWIGTSVLGISYLIAKTVILFSILKWVGALYLIYLGVSALRSKPRSLSSDSPTEAERRDMSIEQAFKIGLLTNVLNPKCALFFVSFFSMVITPETPIWLRSMYGLEIVTIAVLWFSFVATVLSISNVKRVFERCAVWFDRVTGALLIAIGVKVALLRTSE
jgi:RhtB (resistance to homoserine/threonine) family protein